MLFNFVFFENGVSFNVAFQIHQCLISTAIVHLFLLLNNIPFYVYPISLSSIRSMGGGAVSNSLVSQATLLQTFLLMIPEALRAKSL